VLNTTVNAYVGVLSTDAAGGVIYTFPTLTYPSEPASVQAHDISEVIDAQERITQVLNYRIMLGRPLALIPRAQILWTDRAGVTHTLFYEAQKDNAGRGAATTIKAVERL
jgi:hypothetical protein